MIIMMIEVVKGGQRIANKMIRRILRICSLCTKSTKGEIIQASVVMSSFQRDVSRKAALILCSKSFLHVNEMRCSWKSCVFVSMFWGDDRKYMLLLYVCIPFSACKDGTCHLNLIEGEKKEKMKSKHDKWEFGAEQPDIHHNPLPLFYNLSQLVKSKQKRGFVKNNVQEIHRDYGG